MSYTGITKAQLIYSLWETVRQRPVISDSVTMDFINYLVKNARATLIRQELNKGRTIDSYIIQDLGCVPIESVDRSECCSVEVGCTFMRTKEPIPSTIELHNSQVLTRVGPVDKIGRPYDRVQYERVPYLGYSQVSKNTVRYFQKDNDGYLYLASGPNIELLEYINIQGVFENPEDAANFVDCNNKPCFSDDSPYPVKAWMVDIIKTLVLKQLDMIIQAPQDQTVDNKNDYKPTITN